MKKHLVCLTFIQKNAIIVVITISTKKGDPNERKTDRFLFIYFTEIRTM